MRTTPLRTLSASTSMLALLSVGVLAGVLSTTPAGAACVLPSGATEIGATGAKKTLIPADSVVTCPPGSTTTGTFTGRSDEKQAAEGFTLFVQDGATLVGRTSTVAGDFDKEPVVVGGAGRSSNRIVVSKGAKVLGNALDANQRAIVVQGDGMIIENSGTIGANSDTIQAGNFQLPVKNLSLKNTATGLIYSQGDTDAATISALLDATIVNDGIIRRTTTGPSSGRPTDKIEPVAINTQEGASITNSGQILIDATSPRVKGGSAIQGGSNTRIDNSGTIKAVLPNGGSAIILEALTASASGINVLNRESGVIDGSGATNAIRFSGVSVLVENRGKILGGSNAAISGRGEDFRLVQTASALLDGDVSMTVPDTRIGTPAELGFTQAEFDQYCGSGDPFGVCSVNANALPKTATAEWRIDTPVTVDPATTRFSGINTFVVNGAGALTLSQDFAAGNLGVTSGQPVGDFRDTLTFSPQRSGSRITVTGTISDAADGIRGNVVKTGSGTLALTGNSTYTGQTRVTGGELILAGSLATSRITLDSIDAAARLSGTGTTTGEVVVGPGSTVAPGGSRAGDQLNVGDLYVRTGGRIEIDAREGSGSLLVSDRLNVAGKAAFGVQASGYGETEIDVKFDANAKIPALTGIRVVDADSGLVGRAPRVTLDPASLPNGQNFTLDLEATNLGGTFARPGEIIPAGAGGFGTVVLQIKSLDYLPPVITAQTTVINGPIAVPPIPPVLAPPQTPYLIPGATPILAPALIKGPTANVTTPITQTSTPTGIQVLNHGVQVGGTLTPQPQSITGAPISPNAIPIGKGSTVVVVEPPTSLGTSNFVSVSGSYGSVDQRYAQTGTTYRLLYGPHRVDVYNTPANYGNLSPLGVSQSRTERQIGAILTSTLPAPNARPDSTDQANLVAALYPLSLGEINSALDSIAGNDEDPTFVTVLNTREFQDSMDRRLRSQRDGAAGAADEAALTTDRNVWGYALGGYASGDYLNDSEISTWGLVVGADRDMAEAFVAGVALSYTDADIDTDTGSSDEVRTLQAALYGSWTPGPWFVNGNVGASYNWLEIDRAVTVGDYRETLSGDTNATSFFAGIEAGRVYSTSWGALEPTVGLRYQYVDRDGWTEDGHDTLARKISDETLNSWEGIIGLRAYGTYRDAGGILWRPEVRMAYARELGETDIHDTAELLAVPGSSFDVFTAGPGDDVGIFGFRLDGKGKLANYYVDYQAEAREGLFGNQIRVGFNMTF